MKRGRRTARETALKVMFQVEIRGNREDRSGYFIENRKLPKDIKEYSEFLVKGIMENLKIIDRELSSSSKRDFSSLSPMEKTILRIAAFEITHGIEPAIAIDEAVELAKKYGEENSYRVVNGILDQFSKNYAS